MVVLALAAIAAFGLYRAHHLSTIPEENGVPVAAPGPQS
jgi:hypothetical protein